MDLTNEEKRWCRRLERCLKDMPDSLELCAGLNKVDIFPYGTIQKSYEAMGDIDNPQHFCNDYYTIIGINVTGADSQM